MRVFSVARLARPASSQFRHRRLEFGTRIVSLFAAPDLKAPSPRSGKVRAAPDLNPGAACLSSRTGGLDEYLALNRIARSNTAAGNGIVKPIRPTQWRQPSLSTSILKPSGIRGVSPSSGMLHHGQGMPAAPHLQVCGPSHGRPGWVSQTQPQSWQRVHLITQKARRRPE